MDPSPRLSMCGSTAAQQFTVPPRITESIRSHCATVMSATSMPSS
jgi:hypothetical protein